MSEPKLTARTGDTLAAVARLSGAENHKGYDIIHADGYVVAYVIPIDEDGAAGGELARQFAAAPQLLEACETFAEWLRRLDEGPQYPPGTDRSSPDGKDIWREWWNGNLEVFGKAEEQARAALAKARGEEAES